MLKYTYRTIYNDNWHNYRFKNIVKKEDYITKSGISKQLFRNVYYKTVAMKGFLQKMACLFLLGAALLVQNSSFAQYNDYDNNSGYDYNYGGDRDVTYQDFYNELSPYGRWVEYPGQGYVWVPDTGNDFQPYSTNGRWVWTEDYQWMWVSDYDWGWAPFHYGRWDHDDYYGWYWVPGYEWAPAWVAWRDGGDYYGWAPLRPGFSISINIGTYNPPNIFWCFTPRRYITSPRWYDYRVDRSLNINIINYTTIINYNRYDRNYGFRCGPRRYDAELYCGRINPVRFRETYSPGRTVYRNNEINVYRPRVRNDNSGRLAPQRFERYDRNTTFRNNSSGGIRNDNGRRPDDRDRVNNNGGFRNNDNGRGGQTSNGNGRSFDRPQNSNGNDGRFNRPTERGGPSNGDRRLDNSNNNNGGRQFEQPQRQPSRQIERGGGQPNRTFERPSQPERRYEPSPQQQPSRQIERRDERGGGQPNRTFERPAQAERRSAPVQQQPSRQIERREERGGGQPNRTFERPAQAERRSEPVPQQQPSRQIERRENSGGGNSGNSGQNNGRRGRF